MTRRTALTRASMVLVGLVAVVSSIVLPLAVTPAIAADGSNFDPGMIISDDTFYNAGSMNAGDIQAFLNDKGSSCHANSLPCLKDAVISNPGFAVNAFCAALPAANGVTAAQIFVSVAISCNINPQVLMVLVEKEQSLISRSNPSDYSYRYATGFDCPDSSGCSDATSGFVTQVYLAAKQFQRYRVNPGSYNYQAGYANNILYNPDPACGSSSVFIKNQATAGLYNYTPYQPNAAALSNLYGIGDNCSSYGNRNFWRMFTDWFNVSGNLLTNASFESGVNNWGFVNGPLDRQLVGPTSGAQSGQYFLAMYAAHTSLSLSQDVFINPQLRQTYTASIWVQSGTTGKNHSLTLALWGLGGEQEVASTTKSVGNSWTQVTVALPITKIGHTALRVEIYLNSTDSLLLLDNTSLTGSASQVASTAITMQSPSFENGIANWEFKNGFMNRQIYNFAGVAEDGNWFLAANTDTAGRSVGQDVPVSGARGDSYTATVWIRAGDVDSYSATLALWGFGGAWEPSSSVMTVGKTWTSISTTLTITQASISNLRLEVYLNSNAGDLYIDNATIVPNLLPNPSFESGAGGWDTGLNSGVLTQMPATAALTATDGSFIGSTSAAFTGGSFATDARRRTAVGETYTATIWMRAASPGTTWNGTVAFWALGGATEAAVQNVAVPDTWTLVTLQLPIAQTSHDTLRLEVYTASPGAVLYVDGASIR